MRGADCPICVAPASAAVALVRDRRVWARSPKACPWPTHPGCQLRAQDEMSASCALPALIDEPRSDLGRRSATTSARDWAPCPRRFRFSLSPTRRPGPSG